MGGLRQRFQQHLAEGETSDRTFGATVGGLLLALSLVPLLHHRPPVLWMVGVGSPLVVTAAMAPRALRSLKRAWLFVGFAMGQVVNPVVLAVLFYGILTPCGFLMRMFGGDPLRLKRTNSLSYWRERSGPVSSMTEQF